MITHPIKIIGYNVSEFEKECLGIIKPKLTVVNTKSQKSKGGRYLALTVTVEVSSDRVIHQVFDELGKLPYIKTVL
jgi:putative lipoic acid-binding regulatory protein